MDPSEFTEDCPGELKTIRNNGEELLTFVPNTLPPRDSSVGREAYMNLLADASFEIGRGMSRIKGSPLESQLKRLLCIVDAVHSVRIENENAQLSEVFGSYCPAYAGTEVARENRLAKNYADILLNNLNTDTNPYDRETLKETHTSLFSGEATPNPNRGEFRTSHAGIIGRNGNLKYVPPSPEILSQHLQSLERFDRLETGNTDLEDAIYSHYRFESLHPFADGNGRVGRISLQRLLYREYHGVIVPPISLSLNQLKDEYFRRLEMVSKTNDWTGYMEFMLERIIHSAMMVIAALDRLVAYREYLRDSYDEEPMRDIIDYLFGHPVASTAAVADECDIDTGTAQGLLDRLADDAVVVRKNGAYFADEIISKASKTYVGKLSS